MRRIREVLRLRAELGPNLSAIAAGARLARSADSDEGGHLFQSHRGHHSNLMAATVPISWRPGWHRLEGRFWSCHRGAVRVKRQGAACVNAA